MNSDFYRAFEDKHRGSRESIKGRLAVYLPFAEILKDLHPHACAVDLGCGRGEWLELLGELGITAHGVDLDDGMLEGCRELDLSHSKENAIAFLKGLPDESQIIVSGFHLAEHLPFAELQTLVQEALRVLRPAGLLILETPNPENFSVGTSGFYLDPSHQRPLPPELLSFLPEHYGYYRTKVLRLQESPDLVLNQAPALLSLLNGVSPDYAIVSQKSAEPENISLFDELFTRDYGLTVETLAMRYESNINKNFIQSLQFAQNIAEQTEAKLHASQQGAAQVESELVESRTHAAQVESELVEARTHAAQVESELVEARAHAVQVESELAESRAHAQWLENEWNAAKAKVDELNQNCHHWWTVADVLDRECKSVCGSRSWRSTAPLRVFGQILRRWRAAAYSVPGTMKQGTKSLIKSVFAHGIRFVMARPMLKTKCLIWVQKYPEVEAKLRRFAAARGLTAFSQMLPTIQEVIILKHMINVGNVEASTDMCHFTPGVQRIYADLMAEIDIKEKEGRQ